MGGLPSLNRVFKLVLNLASYIRFLPRCTFKNWII